MKASRNASIISALQRQKGRLDAQSPLCVIALLIPFFAAPVLSLFAGFETSSRLRNIAQTIEHTSQPVTDHDVWLSVGIKDQKVYLTSNDGATLTWGTNGPTESEQEQLNQYLKTRARSLVQRSTIRGQIQSGDNVAAIAADQTLTVSHIRPVIYALAAAGFTKYGFETRVLKQ